MPLTFEPLYAKQHYHWFWGWQFLENERPNHMLSQLKDYQSHPEMLKRHIEQLKAIQAYPFWQRGLHWLFNITHYAERHALLSAFFHQAKKENNHLLLAYFEPLKGSTFMQEPTLNTQENSNESQPEERRTYRAYAYSCFKSVKTQFLKMTPIPSSLNAYDDEHHTSDQGIEEVSTTTADDENTASETISTLTLTHSSLPKENEHVTLNIEQEKEAFIITTPMLPHLITLGLPSPTLKTTLPLTTLKSAYRKQILATHPDKHPGHEMAFRAAQGAYKEIKSLLSSAPSSSFDLHDALSKMDEDIKDLFRQCEELTKSFIEIKAGQIKIKEQVQKFDQKSHKFDQQLQESEIKLNRSVKEIDISGKKLDRSGKEQDILKEEEELQENEMNTLQEEEAELWEMLDQLKAASADEPLETAPSPQTRSKAEDYLSPRPTQNALAHSQAALFKDIRTHSKSRLKHKKGNLPIYTLKMTVPKKHQ